MMESRLQIPKCILTVLNQLYELERKLNAHGDPANIARNIGKIRDAFAEDGFPIMDAQGGRVRLRLVYEDPMGQPFRETQTDLEATIAGTDTEDLVVVEVIKPVIRATVRDGISEIVQQGVVIVESRKEADSP
jgi:hypothetical protein